MNGMYFKSIFIADIQEHKARFQKFDKGFNVITSKENHVGKSSLLKSLYYTMGAEVAYDEIWDKNSKLYIVEININEEDYIIARFLKGFAVLKNDELILLTNNVSHDLAELYEKIFAFSVYLPDKRNQKIQLAPPAFTFMPYYIDQDTGWEGLYNSFANIEQYKKIDREKSLYYHLNIYNKHTIDLLVQKDKIKGQIEVLVEQEEKTRITIEALSEETDNILPAENLDELERNLKIPKEKIDGIISDIGENRNQIQLYETMVRQYQHQLEIITEYHKIKGSPQLKPSNEISVCPKCGYSFNKDIYEMVRSNYNINNEDYLCQQIQLLINSANEKLNQYKRIYVELMEVLEKEENAFKASQDSYELFIRQRGLQYSLNDFMRQLEKSIFEQKEKKEELKLINKQLRDLPNKQEVEEKYIDFVKTNIIKLDAWNSAYDGNIKLLKPIKAQGTLENKIILAQCIGLFQTMDFIDSNAIRFPFVVDSPRGKEASFMSSKDIINLIFELDSLPQVILATMDFKEYSGEIKKDVIVTELTEKRELLNTSTYDEYKDRIEEIMELMQNIS
ncbi:MAG: hypothetical protein ACLVMI_03875 [Clostridia bacterium]